MNKTGKPSGIAATARHIFVNPERETLRSGWRVMVFLLLVFGPLLGVSSLVGESDAAQERPSTILAPIIVYAILIIWTLVATTLCLRFFDEQKLRSIGYQLHRGWWRDYLIGAAMATAMVTVIVGIEWAAGILSLSWSRLSANDLLYGLLVGLALFNIAAAFEELVLRGYPLQTLLRDIHPAWAVVVTSALFGLFHGNNPNISALGILNTILAGVWLAVAYLKTRSLWLCTGLHWSWNWAMSSVYGLSVSGLEGVVDGSLFQATQTGPAWLTGGGYGPEGGLLATGVIGVGAFILRRAGWLAPAEEVLEEFQSSRA